MVAGVVAGWQAGVVAGWQAGVVAVTEDLVQRGWLTKIKYIFGGYIFTPKITKNEIHKVDSKYFLIVIFVQTYKR